MKTNLNTFFLLHVDALIPSTTNDEKVKKDKWEKGKFITLKVHKSLLTRRHTKLLLSRH